MESDSFVAQLGGDPQTTAEIKNAFKETAAKLTKFAIQTMTVDIGERMERYLEGRAEMFPNVERQAELKKNLEYMDPAELARLRLACEKFGKAGLECYGEQFQEQSVINTLIALMAAVNLEGNDKQTEAVLSGFETATTLLIIAYQRIVELEETLANV